MAGELGQKFYDLIRKHMELGISVDCMQFNELQKQRVKMCEEVYMRFATDPYMDLKAYLKNKYGRTPSEIRGDLKVIDFIASFYDQGQRNIEMAQVKHTARLAMRSGAESGDLKTAVDGAKLLTKVSRLDQAEETREDKERLFDMPLVITTDVSRKFDGKKNYDNTELERVRKKYGVKKDPWQEMVEEAEEVEEV